MRLIQASSLNQPDGLVFKDFSPNQLPPYAILSHTWGEDEVIWADFQKGTATQKKSFSKIRYSCLQAIADDLEWVWIDSACIDKSSSAELSEAINCMYEWYQRSEVCYAHLEGASATVDASETTGEFAGCRWFTRGWTLQELLAPKEIAFFSEDWVKIGDKAALCRTLSVITGIDEEILTGVKALESASVAKRMSWAAHRKTTRPEDIAYCLMGIFDVNMPMLYGEGQKAFLRLQEEIMKRSDDQSLFAWASLEASTDAYHGLLAKSPLDFAYSNSVIPYQDWEPRLPYQLTHRGLHIELPVTPREEGSDTIYIAALDCPPPPDYEDGSFLAIYLKKLPYGDQQYARIRVGQFGKVRERGRRQTIYVKQNISLLDAGEIMLPRHFFQLRMGPPQDIYRAVGVIADPKFEQSNTPIILSARATVRKWLPQPNAVVFVGPKVPGQLVCAVMFERIDDRGRILVLLGTTVGMRVGSYFIELPPKPADNDFGGSEEFSFEAIQGIFRPTETARLTYNEANVHVDTVITNGSKYFLVDVHLESIRSLDSLDDAFDAARSVYNRAVGRENKAEVLNQHQAKIKVKKPSIWKRLKEY